MHNFAKRFFLTSMLVGLVSGLPGSAVAASLPFSDIGPMPEIVIETIDRGYVSPVGAVIVHNYFNPPPRPWDGGFHRGVDLAVGAGAPIVSPSAGVVTFVGSVFGKPTVTIVHPDGLTSSLEPVVTVMLVPDDSEPDPQPKPTKKPTAEPEVTESRFIEVPIIRVGDTVGPGTKIGVLGFWPDAAGSNASHCPGTTCVHWGVRRSENNYVDPLWLLGLAAPIILIPN
jgi:hypothetical protein